MTTPVPLPGILPTRPQVSLLTVAARLQEAEWNRGVRHRQAGCPNFHVRGHCQTGAKEEPEDSSLATFYPFFVYVPVQCDSLTEGQAAELAAEATQQEDAVTPYAASRELWTGSANAGAYENPSLQSPEPGEPFDPSRLVLAGAATNPVNLIGALLAAYADETGGGGAVLHVPLRIVPALTQNGTIRQDGSVYRVGDALVSPGPGYPWGAGDFGPRTALSPGGLAALATQVFIYVTGPVEHAEGPITVSPDPELRWRDRRTNLWYALAERQAILRFDPCTVFAGLATVPAGA